MKFQRSRIFRVTKFRGQQTLLLYNIIFHNVVKKYEMVKDTIMAYGYMSNNSEPVEQFLEFWIPETKKRTFTKSICRGSGYIFYERMYLYQTFNIIFSMFVGPSSKSLQFFLH